MGSCKSCKPALKKPSVLVIHAHAENNLVLVNWQNIRFEEGIARFDKMLLLEILFFIAAVPSSLSHVVVGWGPLTGGGFGWEQSYLLIAKRMYVAMAP